MLATFDHQSRQLYLLHQIRNLVARETDLDAFLRAIVEATHQIFGYPLVAIYRLQDEQLLLQHIVGYPCEIKRMPITRGIMGRAIRRRQPELVVDAAADPDYIPSAPHLNSEIVIPLINQHGIFGAINIEGSSERPLGEDDMQMLLLLGQHVSLGVERAQLFRELSESENRYRTLIDNLPGVVYRCLNDEHWTALYLNDNIVNVYGYPAADFIGNNQRDLESVVHPDDRTWMRAHLDEAVANHRPYNLIYRIIHRDGKVRWVTERGQAIFDESGQARWVEGVVFDISELKRAEVMLAERAAEIEEVNESLDAIIENLPVMVFMKEAEELRFVRWNKAAEELTGLNRQEILGKTDHDFFPAEQADHFVRNDRAVLHGDRVVEMAEERITTRHHGTRLLYTRKVPIWHHDGKPRYLLGISIDITERREREEAMRRLNDELARAAQLKDEFLANMSHELRTPLNAILTISESLNERVYGPVNQRQTEMLGKIHDSGHHLLSLINDILDVSKIVSGKLELHKQAVAVAQLCRNSLQMVQETARKKRIKLFQTQDQTVSLVFGDERRLLQILINLLSNAVKFTPEGGKVGLEITGDSEHEVVQFTVWDTGIGISVADQARLFQPFVQLDSSLARHHEGSGLGLALVYRLADLHGGSITLESEPNHGSRFTVTLPWTEHSPVPSQPNRVALLPPETVVELPMMHENAPLILLAEDNETSTEAFENYLLTRGYRIITARNGAEAIQKAKDQQPDLILMDIQMPEVDGLEATQRIRALPNLAQTPIIALTALVMPGDRERCLAAGVNEYLSKPFSLRTLAQLIETQLQSSKVAGSRVAG